MEFRTLRALVEVVRSGGFSRAAEKLNATQSTVSKAVRQLEDEVGVPLLDRIGHRSRLTSAGEVVYRRGLKLLADRDALITELDEIAGLRRGVLRIGLPPIGSSILFAPVFTLYRQRYPGIEVQLVEHGADRLEDMLRAGELDLAASLLPVSEEFDWRPVRREPLVALVSVPQAEGLAQPLRLSDLRDIPFVLFESGFALNRIILDACRASGFEPAVAARSSQIDFIVELAGAGLGVAFLPRMIATQRARPSVRRLALDAPETDWRMALLWRRGAYLPHAARAWLEIAASQPVSE